MSVTSTRPHRLAMPPAARVRRRPLAKVVHGATCSCCRPSPGPADAAGASLDLPAWTLAGFGVAMPVVQLVAWLTGTPGLSLMFGAWS